MTDETSADGLRDKIARQSEETLGKIAQDLLENPLVSGALSRAFEARERAGQAQEAAMGALNLPSAADLERLTRRLRSVSQRLEGIEDAVDRLDEKLARPLGDADAGRGDRAAPRCDGRDAERGRRLALGAARRRARRPRRSRRAASRPRRSRAEARAG